MNFDKEFDSNKSADIRSFRSMIYAYYTKYARVHLPWRTDYNPYHIFVSEIMLQQTQVDRVISKFIDFVGHFKDFNALAQSSLEEVLYYWKGLGYNRRAASLRNAAKIIVENYNGLLPETHEQLMTLPGIGPATASSIQAFACNKPVVFLETNIRTVLIYHFLRDSDTVHDMLLTPIARKVLDKKNPRKWYSALMDYGTMLKSSVGNLSQKSTSYKKQSRFKGSRRELRGNILDHLLDKKSLTCTALSDGLKYDTKKLAPILDQLVNEGMIRCERGVYSIGK